MADPAEAPRSIADANLWAATNTQPQATLEVPIGWKERALEAERRLLLLTADLQHVAADRARLQQEYGQLRETVALLTHLVDPHRLDHVEQLSLADLEQGLADQCVTRVDEAEAALLGAETALTALRHALTQLPRYWVWIDRAFPEPMACLKAELSPEGEWVKFEDVQKALTP